MKNALVITSFKKVKVLLILAIVSVGGKLEYYEYIYDYLGMEDIQETQKNKKNTNHKKEKLGKELDIYQNIKNHSKSSKEALLILPSLVHYTYLGF